MASDLNEAIEGTRSVLRERNNWYMHSCYMRKDFDTCLRKVEEQLRATNGRSEYALYLKALIYRQKGRVQESLTTFQAALCLNPMSVANLKQVGISLYLLGRHKSAIEVFDEAELLAPEDRDLHHNKGLCYFYLKQYDKAESCFESANSILRHESTYIQLGKLYENTNRLNESLSAFMDALDIVPESPELLRFVGQLYAKHGDKMKAFEYLGNSLTYDNKNPDTILGAASIIQDNGDVDVALTKYRTAIHQEPTSAPLWNNIGLCFFTKSFQAQGSRIIAAISCLRRAAHLRPLSWVVNYNLGAVYLSLGQWASAFNHFSASINLNPQHAGSYAYLAVALAKLGDFDNACGAYERALSKEDTYSTRLNYAVTLYRNDEAERARGQLSRYQSHIQHLGGESVDPETAAQARALATVLNA